ncbi:potassium channel family protein [Arthrobacter sp. ES3-54]|jgi:hypothetical protein|uniref:potassium channel family protein n=1 Tax=Arthrobacter sp. ES3-54 TaxID=1502991 RepID=UPI002405DBD9|nr:potassium channel family protein [Arthrobacter sp. ES3-54]MDF9749462.1 hypothetical protein [Arthrobacter sp. ES3-54]
MDFVDALWTAVGAGLILMMLADVFHTLLYPHGSGPVCRTIMRAFWLLTRSFRGRAGTLSAPVSLVAVIAAWTGLAILGWALLYLPHLPGGFVYGEGVPQQGDFAEAVYISMGSLSTVGYGEIVAGPPLLRLLAGLQSITGFALLTATVSWLLQLFPALTRRRTLAHQLNLMREAGGQEGIAGLDPTHSAALIESLARSVATVSVDLSSLRESYYFREVEQRSSLAATVAYAQDLSSEAKLSDNTELRFAGRMLHASLDDLAAVLRGKFGHSGETSSAVFDSYALHHRHRQEHARTGH